MEAQFGGTPTQACGGAVWRCTLWITVWRHSLEARLGRLFLHAALDLFVPSRLPEEAVTFLIRETFFGRQNLPFRLH